LTTSGWRDSAAPAQIWATGLPCQAYSKAGLGKQLADHRGIPLMRGMLSGVAAARPPFLVLKEVKPFVESQAFHLLVQVLSMLGYQVRHRLLPSVASEA
jgi:site-specific DNA-cytosine methylase